MPTQRVFLPFGIHRPTSFKDHIRLLFEDAGSRLAIAPWIDSDLAETRHAPRHSALAVALAEERLVVASRCAHVGLLLDDVWKVAMQKRRIDRSLACHERQNKQHQQRSHFPTTARITRRKLPPMIFLMSVSL